MAEMFLNVDFSAEQTGSRSNKGNRKHENFVKRRRYLEKRGFLKQKQLPPKPQNRSQQPPPSWKTQPDVNGNSCDRTGPRPKNSAFHPRGPQQQGAPSVPHRTVTMGAPHLSSTLTVSVNSAPNRSRVAADTSKQAPRPEPQTGNRQARDMGKPYVQDPSLLSEFESGIPSVTSTPSYKIVAIDCEMVGTGFKGKNSDLARCSIVNYQGDVVFDKYIKPSSPVTDYRTRWSGIRREHLVNATPFALAQKEILKILNGKLVIGHAIQNDYKAIGYFHPKEMTRDTSKIPLLNRKAGFPEKEVASLKRLAKQLLQKNIQTGRAGHSSVEDAKTTMELYRIVEAEFERELATGGVLQ